MLNKKLQKNYTMLNNDILQLKGLSFGARGLYGSSYRSEIWAN